MRLRLEEQLGMTGLKCVVTHWSFFEEGKGLGVNKERVTCDHNIEVCNLYLILLREQIPAIHRAPKDIKLKG